MTIQDILIMFIIIYITFNFIKSMIIGSSFSVIKYFIFKEDYIKWYNFRQKYISPKKRLLFNKKNVHEN